MHSPNYNNRKSAIDMVVIHATQMETAQSAIERLCNPVAEVSAHYVISRTGEVVQLVKEAQRAWHAGVSYWDGQTDINSRSVGIELDNMPPTPFSEPQMQALETLLRDLITRYKLQLKNIVGHSDIALGRKVDPGPKFDWRRLERQRLAFDRIDDRDALGYCRKDPEKLQNALMLRFGH